MHLTAESASSSLMMAFFTIFLCVFCLTCTHIHSCRSIIQIWMVLVWKGWSAWVITHRLINFKVEVDLINWSICSDIQDTKSVPLKKVIFPHYNFFIHRSLFAEFILNAYFKTFQTFYYTLVIQYTPEEHLKTMFVSVHVMGHTQYCMYSLNSIPRHWYLSSLTMKPH